MAKKKNTLSEETVDTLSLADKDIPIGRHMGVLVSPEQSKRLRGLLQEIAERSQRNIEKKSPETHQPPEN